MPAESTKTDAAKPSEGVSAPEVRRRFLDFFASRGHTAVPSSPVVPHDDPTLLFTNAGMNQFKPLFLGQADPNSPIAGLKRAVNTQKCIRAGGKHNDLEDVGRDTYHHTFFEMLGNWSFGDYFKAEAIEWAWEFLTKELGLDPERLYATYFGGGDGQDPDDEAKKFWLRYLPESRVLPGSIKDNFWEMGDTGPCGPCSEIHYDRIGGRNAAERVNADDPDVIELWNLVFIQFDRQRNGSLRPLPQKHVDTGMGLERLVSVLQDVRSNYDTDVFTPLFVAIRRETSAPRAYTGKLGAEDEGSVDTAYRVIADHIRTLSFAIADGATPSNEGRGYVLRRVLRRAVRFGRQMLGAESGFLSRIVPDLAEQMGEAFGELKQHEKRIAEIILEEEESFGRTLDRGLKLFNEVASGASTISGEDAFKLYDTYGFPVDLTQQMAEERGIGVDVEGFDRCMEEQKERSRAGAKGGEGGELRLSTEAVDHLRKQNIPPTDDSRKFTGKPMNARVRAIYNGSDFDLHTDAMGRDGKHMIGVVLDHTNFYAEAGGQVGDNGRITVSDPSKAASHDFADHGEFRVVDVQAAGGFVLHIGHMIRGEVRVDDGVTLTVDRKKREPTQANHTATHLLNLALRAHVSASADQKGSLVEPDRLRFDFSHNKPLTDEEIEKVEKTVVDHIARNLVVDAGPAPLETAKSISGLRAVFGEKYPDPVRIVAIGARVEEILQNPGDERWANLSIEFCGGTHVDLTGQIGPFAIVSETGIAKGIRRIEAVSGVPARAAIAAAETLERRITEAWAVPDEEAAELVSGLNAELDTLTMPLSRKAELRKKLGAVLEKVKQARKAHAKAAASEAAKAARSIAESAKASGESVIVATLGLGADRGALQQAAKTIGDMCPEAAVMLLSPDEDTGVAAVLAHAPKDAIARGLKAGDWVREAAIAGGGKGGGRPDQAQGGGIALDKLDSVTERARAFAMEKLG